MAWENTLLPASFRGITFEVVSTSDDIERAVATHEYPYLDGANVEDLGRAARRLSMVAVFYGDDYEIRLQQFLAAIDVPGAAELIHPVFGALQAQFMRSNVPHDAATPDYTKVTLEFIEARLHTPLFDRVLPLQKVDAINQFADGALAAAQSRFWLDMTAALNLPAALRDKLSSDLLNVMDNMRVYCDQLIGARGWLASGLYYLNYPVAFVDDLSSGLISRLQAIFSPMDLRLGYTGVSDMGGYGRGSIATVWQAPLVSLQQPLLTAATPTQPFLTAHLMVQQAIAVAGASAALFSQALDTAVLTPADIESVAADARTSINAAIAQVRLSFPDLVQARPITESLKMLALSVTEAAEQLIRAKPPLIDRIVDTPGNLQLLAHLWYGDYHRADELLRLNPLVRNPNSIQNGAVLRAYAA